MLTDNAVLVDNIRETPTLYCVQKTAEKKVVTEDDLVRANIASFGNDVGKVTNWITGMFDVQAQFEPGSEEYNILDYRIQCGQHYQQCCIDKTKGIISKPMPRYWHDRAAVFKQDLPEDDLQRLSSVAATKKPYFMRYIYPKLMREYNTYIKSANAKCMWEFRETVEQLESKDECELTDRQREFLQYYHAKMPVSEHNCIMNRICRKVEAAFATNGSNVKQEQFDTGIMKSGSKYTGKQYCQVKELFGEHQRMLKEYAISMQDRKINSDNHSNYVISIIQYFVREGIKISSNSETLCDIVVDVCYSKAGSRRFVWDLVGSYVVDNLLAKNDMVIKYPIFDPDGDIEYGGDRYSIARMVIDEGVTHSASNYLA